MLTTEDLILSNNKNLYLFPSLPEGIIAGFSKRSYDAGFGQEENKIRENRRRILSGSGVELKQLVCVEQVHSENVVIVTKADKAKGSFNRGDAAASCDAMITKERNLALAVLTADCLPVFIIDKEKDIIAIAHAGWKGTKKSIAKNVIFVMQKTYGSAPEDLIIYFGPAIRSCCYEVGEEFLNYLNRGIARANGKIFLDLIHINRLQLEESGVLKENIFDCRICTSCQNDKFFSHRKEGSGCGRQMSLIMKKTQQSNSFLF